VRTFLEIEQVEEFHVTRELLVHRCVTWAQARGLPADPLVLEAALDSRHLSTDGRMAFWTPAHVRRLLLEWLPQQVDADPSELKDAPQSLRTLLRFLADSGLRDPRGASMEENEDAITEAAAQFPAVLAALDNGAGVTAARAVSRFAEDVQAGRASFDVDLLDRLMGAQVGEPELAQERAIAQLPVSLPSAAELAEAAAGSLIVRQLRAFAEWVGADGRALTSAGNLKITDARTLVDLLGTDEEDLKVRTSAELPHLNLIFSWAKKAGLVRATKTRVTQVAKAAPLIDDAEALWQRAFDTFFELRDAVCVPIWADEGPSMLHEVYAEAVPDVLNTIYSMPHPVPVARLEESVWQSCRLQFPIETGSFLQQEGWRGRAGNDLVQVFKVLDDLGAVDRTHGVADEMFSVDLVEDFEMPFPGERPISGLTAARLRDQLSQPGELVALTGLGTRAMRQRLLAEGREAALVGDLAAAEPAELLGVIAEHYTPEAGEAEISGWLARHGGDIEPLLDAVRACPFRARASAMLNVLGMATPDWTAVLHRLRDDPVLAPLAVMALLDEDALGPDDLTGREQVLMVTEGFLQLLELGGPDAIHDQLTQMPEANPAGLLEVMRSCGHPGTPTMRDFQELVTDSSSPPPE
jgi:hypothetical protein